MNELVVLGHVLTVDDDRRVHRNGAVYIHDGRIEAVTDARAAEPAGYKAAPRLRPGGVVAPGLIDLHNHLAYNTLPLWVGRDEPYTTRYQWPGAKTYGRDVSNPAQALGIAAPAAALRFAEVKAVVGGVTSIQGSPTVSRAFPGWMLRNVEKEKLGQGDAIYQSVLPATGEQLDKTAPRLADGKAFFYHLAEGVDPKLARGVLAARHAPLRAGRTRRHPLDGPQRRGLRALEETRRRCHRVVAVLESLALRRHDRSARRSPPRAPRVSRLGLDAVGDAQRARRAEGRGRVGTSRRSGARSNRRTWWRW